MGLGQNFVMTIQVIIMYNFFVTLYTNDFCLYFLGALQDNLKSDMGINTAQFANLYAWYSWPNVILCFIGGFLLDR